MGDFVFDSKVYEVAIRTAHALMPSTLPVIISTDYNRLSRNGPPKIGPEFNKRLRTIARHYRVPFIDFASMELAYAKAGGNPRDVWRPAVKENWHHPDPVAHACLTDLLAHWLNAE